MSRPFMKAVAALCLAASASVAAAATVFETTALVASTPTAAAQLPEPIDFTVLTAANYVAKLRDLNLDFGLPVAFASLSAIVTRDLQVVAKLDIEAGDDESQASFPATPGTYRIHVLGTLPANLEGGAFGFSVAPQAGGTALVDTAGTIAADASAPPGTAELQAEFDIADGGNYQIALTDHAFPALLAGAPFQLAVETPSGTSPVTVTAGAFTAVAGTYHLTVIATAAAAAGAGLYSVRVSGGPSSAVVYQSTNRVGRVPPPIEITFPATGSSSLTLADAAFPGPLTSLAVLVAQSSTAIGQRTGAGSVTFAASQGRAEVFALPQTATIGAFTLRITQGAALVLADVVAADASPAADTPAIYSFAPSQAIAAGTYRLTLHDFRFPLALPSLRALVIQSDSIVESLDAAGQKDLALQAGRVKTLVAVQPPVGTPAQPGSGLLGIDLSVVQGANVFESTQGVGGLFRPALVQIPVSGNYELTVADLQFPAPLGMSALAVTRGTELVTQIFGGSKVTRPLTQGTYVLNFIGQPAQNEVHGSYGLKVADPPPAPTVTLAANPGTLTAGGRTTLQWSTTNATACTAANGWTGSKGTSGSEQSAALNANTTFELSCSGPGGSISASAAVTVNPPNAGGSGGGGGGSTGLLLLIYMASFAFARRRGRAN